MSKIDFIPGFLKGLRVQYGNINVEIMEDDVLKIKEEKRKKRIGRNKNEALKKNNRIKS